MMASNSSLITVRNVTTEPSKASVPTAPVLYSSHSLDANVYKGLIDVIRTCQLQSSRLSRLSDNELDRAKMGDSSCERR